MLRVIIADDEERIIKLIQILADWQALDMQVVGVASNGLDALQLVETLNPDILVTDIRMPGLTGLEVIRRAKAVSPMLEIIIVSGFAQFDYAQTAIQHGVGEYLLKPINKEALNDTLRKMGERCNARKNAQQDAERMRINQQQDRNRVRQNLLGDLLDGRFKAKDAGDLERVYHVSCKGDCYQVFLIKMDYDIEQFAEPSLGIVRNRIRDIFGPLLTELCTDHVFMMRGAYIYGMMNYPSGNRVAIKSRLREGLNQLLAQGNLFGPVLFTLALGRVTGDPSGLFDSLYEAKDAAMERLIEGTGKLLDGVRGDSHLPQMNLLQRYSQEITRAIDAMDGAAAARAADALLDSAMAVSGVRGGELLTLTQAAGMAFVSRLDLQERGQDMAKLEAELDQCDEAEQLVERLKQFQMQQLDAERERRQNREAQPIRAAKQYIHEHFAQPLTLEQLGAEIGFSPNYLSTIFKKETGEGFIKYLARVRIEEAKNLLRDTRMSVVDVCRQVGYEDIKHFNRTFKQEAGITPGEYRKLYG